jgi:cytochrome o ubiquinol oxidase subunit II
MMKKKYPVKFMLIFAGIVLLIFLLMQPLEILRFHGDIEVLFPKGIIGIKERDLLLIIQGVMLLIVIPVYILTFIFSWVYRAHNEEAEYHPDMDDHKLAEFVWWGFPCLIILVIGTLTWIRTFELDPYRTLAPGDQKSLRIQVVALQWKWLFIYPEEKIATVNYFEFPVQTPVHFEITSDAPMNSFWIPKLGGQIYAMPKMRTNLNLSAEEVGDFSGYSANISGVGFSGMTFTAKSRTPEEYQQWVQQAGKSSQILNLESYEQLALPSQNNPEATFVLKDDQLFETILMKYMQSQNHQGK